MNLLNYGIIIITWFFLLEGVVFLWYLIASILLGCRRVRHG